MTCDLCSKNNATVHLTEIINDETRELHLCESCAREKGSSAAEQFGLAGLLAGLADFGAKNGPKVETSPCAQCGLTYEDFRKTGRLGCGNCYENFSKVLSPLLKRVHGSNRYQGRLFPPSRKKKAGPEEELGRLKERLKAAVAAEDFEEAARLRDRLRTQQAKTKKTS
ncbi:MAG: UvrB/UvrC motif-containing protein [Candidatus Omnitrophica bacterium]|nr:UvrB/UvrC motif-containing protein [Candidatus Omnitrophota bacterium]